ncbi:MAG: hypothetical protein KDA66_09645, partial [Planctomycetaceae bacterium]|nr:hypothetical protein [Planctomycetaceae bacterium]
MTEDAPTHDRRAGSRIEKSVFMAADAVDLFGLLVGTAPSLYVLYLLAGVWLTLAGMEELPAGIRPM